jgi:hypothetical protein
MAQLDNNKKKDNELAKLRREIDQLNMNFESQSQALKVYFFDSVFSI